LVAAKMKMNLILPVNRNFDLILCGDCKIHFPKRIHIFLNGSIIFIGVELIDIPFLLPLLYPCRLSAFHSGFFLKAILSSQFSDPLWRVKSMKDCYLVRTEDISNDDFTPSKTTKPALDNESLVKITFCHIFSDLKNTN